MSNCHIKKLISGIAHHRAIKWHTVDVVVATTVIIVPKLVMIYCSLTEANIQKPNDTNTIKPENN